MDHTTKLTGIKHLDYEILNKLSDEELVRFCSVNTHYKKFCDDDQTMWMNRVLYKFPLTEMTGVSNDEMIMKMHLKQKGDRSWSKYYIEDLSVFNKRNEQNAILNDILKKSSENGKLVSVIIAVSKGADINDENDDPVRLAAENGHLDVVKYLASKGARINVWYILTSASSNGHLDVVKYLVENGGNVHSYYDEAYIQAAVNGHLNIVKYFAENGIIDINNMNNAFAIYRASSNGRLDVVKYLVENEDFVNYNLDTTLQAASEAGHLEIVKYLISKGADVNNFTTFRRIDPKVEEYIFENYFQ